MARGSNSLKRKATRSISNSKRVKASTKRAKPPGNVFGSHSQFRGVGTGVAGDPRR